MFWGKAADGRPLSDSTGLLLECLRASAPSPSFYADRVTRILPACEDVRGSGKAATGGA